MPEDLKEFLSQMPFFTLSLYLVAFFGLTSASIFNIMEKLLAIHFKALTLPALGLARLNAESKYAILALLTLLTLGLFGFTRKQRYAPAPIICVSEAGDLKAARQRFVFDAQTMLLEYYTQKEEKPFCVLSPSGERLMIPSKYVEELQRLTWPMILSVNLGQDKTLIETLFGGGQGSRADHVLNLDSFGEVHS